MLTRAAVLILALLLTGCSAATAGPATGQTRHLSILVTNKTPFDMILYSSPRHGRIGRVGSLSSECLKLRTVGSGELVIYARIFGAGGGGVFAPPLSFDRSRGWSWTISTAVINYAPQLVPAAVCGQKVA